MGTLRVIEGEKELSIDPKSGVISARPVVGKERPTRSTGIKVPKDKIEYIGPEGKEKARIPEEYLKRARIVLRKDILPTLVKDQRKYSGQLFIDEFPKWQDEQSKRWEPGTTADCNTRWKVYEAFSTSTSDRNKSIKDWTEGDWEDFKTWLPSKYPDYKRLSGLRKYLSMFFLYKFRKGDIPRQLKFSIPKEEAESGIVLSDRQVLRAIRYARKTLKDEQLELFLWHGWLTGMRPDESYSLQKDRIDWKTGFIRLKKEDVKKNTPPRDVPVYPDHRRYRRYLSLLKTRTEANDGPFVFAKRSDSSEPLNYSSFKKSWIACFRAVGLYNGIRVTPYDLRHTCATNMAKMGLDPVHACRILGTSLEMYYGTYCKPRDTDLKTALGKALRGHR